MGFLFTSSASNGAEGGNERGQKAVLRFPFSFPARFHFYRENRVSFPARFQFRFPSFPRFPY